MATHGKSYTPPKGRPTKRRSANRGQASRIPAMFEWIIVGVVIAALMVAAWYFSNRDGGSAQHNGAPPGAAAVTDVVPVEFAGASTG